MVKNLEWEVNKNNKEAKSQTKSCLLMLFST